MALDVVIQNTRSGKNIKKLKRVIVSIHTGWSKLVMDTSSSLVKQSHASLARYTHLSEQVWLDGVH